MAKRILPYILVAVISAVLTTLFQPLSHIDALAQSSGCQTFKETGKTVCGRFLQYWQQHGGLAQQGLPLSGEFNEVSDLNGKPYTVQYFERAVFEKHPENAAPNDVLLSQLGTFRFKAKYPNGEPASSGQPQPTQLPAGGGSVLLFKGNGVTDTYQQATLKAGNATFLSSSAGGVLQVTLLDPNKKTVAKVADMLGASSLTTNVAVPADGSYLIHIEHDQSGNWTVSVQQ